MHSMPGRRAMNLYDRYSRGILDRREFFRRLSVLAGGSMAAYALLAAWRKAVPGRT